MTRKILLWLHLSAGSLAGVVIFIMSVTGVLLAWQRQIIRWADRGYRVPPVAEERVRVSPENLLAKVAELGRGLPTTLTMRSDTAEPVAAEFGRAAVVYLNPWTGEVLGEGSSTTRAFFTEVENWHRWLAADLSWRVASRGVTGACNLLFLGLVLSGAYLWLPKFWSWQCVRQALWFRRGLRGRARDWNWHNTIGVWCLTPLLVIVSTAVVMSYPWANNLVYRITGSEPPAAGPGRGGAERIPTTVSFAGVDSAWRRAETQVAGWKSIGIRIPAAANAPIQFLIDSGDGGRPDLRAQLTVKRTGEIVRWEPFSANSAGRQLRSWIRFSHTGEAGGYAGITVAALASLGGAFLVGTGISLAIRRMVRAIARRRTAVPLVAAN